MNNAIKICKKHGELKFEDTGKRTGTKAGETYCLICNRERNAKFQNKKRTIINELGEYKVLRKYERKEPIPTTKTCKKHGLLDDVNLSYTEKGYLRCKLCQFERNRSWEKRNPEKVKQYRRQSYLRNCDRYTEESKLRQRKITKEEYLQLIKKQDNKCAICFQEESVIQRKDRSISALSIDHDHVTGKIRGLLCARCNRALGGFKDSEERLLSAINYIRLNNYASTELDPANTRPPS